MLQPSVLRRTLMTITRADRARDAGRWTTAARLYRKALNRFPANPPIWVQYGHALKEAGRCSEAEATYRTAISYDPDSADAHLQLGHVLKIQGKRSEAEVSYLIAAVLDHSSPEPIRELGGFGWSAAVLSELKQLAGVNPAGSCTPGEPSRASSATEGEIDRLCEVLSEAERKARGLATAAAGMQSEIAALRGALSRTLHDDSALSAGTQE
jgi:tetratricopeptide (TPR) repeat protein